MNNPNVPISDEHLAILNTDPHWLELYLEPNAQNFPVDLIGSYDAPFRAPPSTRFATATIPSSLELTNPGALLSPFATGPSSVPPNDASASPLPGLHHATASHSSQSSNAVRRVRYPCTYPGCRKNYTRHPDMRRHASSHDANPIMLFCHHSGCRHGARGFLRKDRLTAHLRAVHGG